MNLHLATPFALERSVYYLLLVAEHCACVRVRIRSISGWAGQIRACAGTPAHRAMIEGALVLASAIE